MFFLLGPILFIYLLLKCSSKDDEEIWISPLGRSNKNK